jgi:hypothetical protein
MPDHAGTLSIRGRASVEIVDGVPEEYLAGAWNVMDAEAAAQVEQNRHARCTTGWRASRSRRTGCATTTSAPADDRDSCKTWPRGSRGNRS